VPDLFPDGLFLPSLETLMNDTARNTKPVSVNGFPLATGPQNVPDAIQYGTIVSTGTSWTTVLCLFGQVLLHSAPQSARHTKIVDILGLCDTISFQGVSSLSMGSVIPHGNGSFSR
jgi:hypothetical protein